MIDDSILPGVGAAIAGIGLSAGFVAFMEQAAARSASKLDEKVNIQYLNDIICAGIWLNTIFIFSDLNICDYFICLSSVDDQTCKQG